MHPWENEFLDSDLHDPLRVERSAAVTDEEAAGIESLCREATPGPFVTDEETDAPGALIATLPDSRNIVSLTMPCPHDEPCLDAQMINANARLICRARYMLLRLLRDRERWLAEREELLAKVRSFETETRAADGTSWSEVARYSLRPR
jgi:hypothetical protein